MTVGMDTLVSPDYQTARARFCERAEARGFRLESFAIGQTGPGGEDLTIDAAILGSDRPERALVVSSGLHGVEGYFGSAVQLGWLDEPAKRVELRPDAAIVLLHALDPFGFAWVRRFDENNVDLNRNFVVEPGGHQGCHPLYDRLNPLLNPENPPARIDLFAVRALMTQLRHGAKEVRSAVAQGQYVYPRGLFFGGTGPSRVQEILEANLPRWLGEARAVMHLDFHTGLGRWGTHKLLLDQGLDRARVAWIKQSFGADRVDHWGTDGIAYPTRGEIGVWCRKLFPKCAYDPICAEFGTYSGLRVLSALRTENQAHHWLPDGHPARVRAKKRLMDAFVPDDPGWRRKTVADALALIERARTVLWR